MTTNRSRRRFSLNRRVFAGGGAAVLAAAPWMRVGAQGATPAPGASPAAIAVINDGTPESELEIFSWWTGPGEHDGLMKLYEAFNGLFPDVEITDAAVAGGAGSNAKAALSTRLQGGDPPDSWQSHAGKELQDLYQGPGYADPLTEIWNTMGLDDVIPQGLNDQVTIDDEKYLIPVGVHMGNVLFANKQVASDNGLEWSDTLSSDDFFAMADTLKEAGIPAIALGSKDSFAPVQLFENTLMGALGGDAYNGLWDGSTDWASEEVTTAIETFGKYLDYVNEDHASLTWDGAMDLVLNGTAFSTSMGDWAYGAAVAKEKTDVLAWAPHPDTDGLYVSVMDGFTLPKDAPHPVNAAELARCGWLRPGAGHLRAVQRLHPGPHRRRHQRPQRLRPVVGQPVRLRPGGRLDRPRRRRLAAAGAGHHRRDHLVPRGQGRRGAAGCPQPGGRGRSVSPTGMPITGGWRTPPSCRVCAQ